MPAVCSLWHCPAGRPGLPLTTTLLCGVRTFLGDTWRTRRRRDRPADSSVAPTILVRRPGGLVGRPVRRQRREAISNGRGASKDDGGRAEATAAANGRATGRLG